MESLQKKFFLRIRIIWNIRTWGIFQVFISDLDGWGYGPKYTMERADGENIIFNSYYLFSPYIYAFINGYLNRPVCYSCPYARRGRVGDITLADFWGVRRFFSYFGCEKGRFLNFG